MALLDEIMEAGAKLPPRQTWVTSYLFPPGTAIVYKAPDEDVVALNPSTWAEWKPVIEAAFNGQGKYASFLEPSAMLLDPVADDDEVVAKVRRDERMRVFATIAAVMLTEVELGKVFASASARMAR